MVRNDFGESHWMSGDALSEQFEVRQVVTEVVGDVHAVFICIGEAKLESTK